MKVDESATGQRTGRHGEIAVGSKCSIGTDRQWSGICKGTGADLRGEENVPAGRETWVALTQRGEFHEVARASLTPITLGPGEVVLRGKTRWAAGDGVGVEYGLERYYVREGTGNPRGKLTVKAVVPDSGRAQIKEVFLDGKPYAEVMRDTGR